MVNILLVCGSHSQLLWLVSDDDRPSSSRPSKRQKSRRPVFPSAVTRMSPKGLFYVIHCMTYEQWQDINAIGFGGLFSLDVDRLPMRLGYWLIDNFNPITTSLMLYGGKELPIRASDVHATLGLPMGPKQVQLASYIDESEEFSEFYHQWRSQFPVTSGLVLITTLQTYIATNQELGGDQFKVNFVVLVVSLMMKNNQRSYVNHHILKSLMDVNDIANYNWCEYILDSLRNAKLNWAVKKNYFEGPLLFLMLFYVDRVVHKKRTVDRDFFTLTGWTTTALYARQKEEMKSFHFGEGTIEDMMVENVNTQSGSVSPNTQPGCQTTIKDYIHELAFKTKATAEHLMSLESLIKDRPPKLYENPDMKKLCNVAMKLMNEPYDEGGCSQNVEVNDLAVTNADPDNPEHEIGSSSPTKVISNATLDDEFYASDEVLLAIQAAEKFCSKKRVPSRPGTSQVTSLLSNSTSSTHCSNPKEYIHDLAVNSARMAENMVILENKYEIGATNFPENDTIKHLHSSTSILYRTYGGCTEETSTSYWFTDSKEEEAVIAFAKAVEDAYNKKRAVTSTRPINQHKWQDDDNSHGDVIPPSFSLGLSQDELFNNPKVALLSPTTNVDHDTVVRDILLEISTDQKDEHGDKKADQEGDDLVQKDDDKSCAEVHEDANTQSDSEKTISDGDCEPDSNSRLSPTRYHVVTRRRGSSAALVPELRSPFIVRDVDTVSSLTKVQRLVCDYIYADFGQESSLHNEKVFMYKGITAIRLQFQSLKPRELVSSAILDCWSAYLNHREISKSDLSPLRFYISTFVLIVFTDYRKNKSDESRYKFFRNAMNDELKQFSRISLKSIDMFFFPVALNAHYYLMVFDLKTPAFYLIDNWLTRAKVENCYGDTPMLVAAAFGRFLKETRDTYSKGDVVCTLTPVRINMPWRTSDNVDDCGVFTMRHMETFMGDPKWKCGLKKNDVATLSKLRDKYVSTLLLFDGNELSTEVLLRAKHHQNQVQRLQVQGVEKEGAKCVDDSNEA